MAFRKAWLPDEIFWKSFHDKKPDFAQSLASAELIVTRSEMSFEISSAQRISPPAFRQVGLFPLALVEHAFVLQG